MATKYQHRGIEEVAPGLLRIVEGNEKIYISAAYAKQLSERMQHSKPADPSRKGIPGTLRL